MAAEFLSTPPPRVATVFLWVAGSSTLMFLSTPPSRVATVRSWRSCSHSCVSIHATLAGGDAIEELNELACVLAFLSTPPSRVATILQHTDIHASACFYPRHPRGWRRKGEITMTTIHAFLSTPPSRVATETPLYYWQKG